jgi:hypothetical protein
MNANVYFTVLRHAWWHRKSQGALWIFKASMMLLGATVPATKVFGMNAAKSLTIAAVLLFVLGMMAWQALLNAVNMLNTPANARLLPYGSKPARTIVKIAGVLLCLGGGLLADALAGLPLLGIAVSGLILAGGGLLGEGRFEGLPFYIGGMFIAFYVANHPGTALSQAIVYGGLALVPLCGMLMMARLFPVSGDRHWLAQERTVRRTALYAGKLDAMPDTVPGWMARLYAARLARDSARRQARALLLHVLGPRAHCSIFVAAIGVAMIAGFAAAAIVRSLPLDASYRDFFAGMLTAMHTVVPSFVLVTLVYMTQVRLGRTKVEQSLVRLTPGMAQGARLNRMLAARQLQQGVWIGVACLLWIFLGNIACGTQIDDAVSVVSLMSPILLLVPLLLRSPATMGNPLNVGAIALTIGAAVALTLGFELLHDMAIAGKLPVETVPRFLLLPFSAGIAAGLCWRRWSVLENGPVALPAGRLVA